MYQSQQAMRKWERKGRLPQYKMCCSLLLLYNYLLINPNWQLHLTLTFLAAAICRSLQTVDAVCLINELIFFFFPEGRFMFSNAFNRNKLNGPELR